MRGYDLSDKPRAEVVELVSTFMSGGREIMGDIEYALRVEEDLDRPGKWAVLVLCYLGGAQRGEHGFALFGYPSRQAASEIVQAIEEQRNHAQSGIEFRKVPIEEAQAQIKGPGTEGIALDWPGIRALSLREFVKMIAADFVVQAMDEYGHAPNTYFAVGSEEMLMIFTQQFVGRTSEETNNRKRFVIEKMRRLFRQLGITRYVQVSEVWISSRDLDEPSNDPERGEAVMYMAEDAETGAAMMQQTITRDSEGKAVLGSLEEGLTNLRGRMVGLLPRRGRVS